MIYCEITFCGIIENEERLLETEKKSVVFNYVKV